MNETIKKVEKIKEVIQSKVQKKISEMTKQAQGVEEPTPVLETAIVDENSLNLYRTNYDLIDDQNGWDRSNYNNF